MRVSDVEIVELDDSCQVQAWVESDIKPGKANWFEPFLLWYRYPAWCRPFLSEANGDPFLAALLVGAMRVEDCLAISAPISSRLLNALPEIQAIYEAFDERAKRIPVEVVAREHSLPADGHPPGNGLFFSLGVDSWYCLAKNVRDHPADAETITQLLYVHGIDVPFQEWDDALPPEIERNLAWVAAETGKTLLPIVTNARLATAVLESWPMLHGGGLIAAALALGAGLRQIHIAASTTYDRLYPWGSHPVLDPLWSTENLTVVHDGCEMNTIDKTRFIAEEQTDLVLATLRPCAGYGPGYNCGGCIKCMRTMTDLLHFGYLDRCQTLPHEIDVARFRQVLRPGGPIHVADFTRRLKALERQELAPGVQQVLREHLAQGMASKWVQQPEVPTKAQGSKRGLVARLRGSINE